MIFRDGILFWRRNKTEMEKEDYIWRRKIYFFQRKAKPAKKNEEYSWRQKICFFAGEKINSRGKGGRYLEKEFFLRRRRITEKEKEDYLLEATPSR